MVNITFITLLQITRYNNTQPPGHPLLQSHWHKINLRDLCLYLQLGSFWSWGLTQGLYFLPIFIVSSVEAGVCALVGGGTGLVLVFSHVSPHPLPFSHRDEPHCSFHANESPVFSCYSRGKKEVCYLDTVKQWFKYLRSGLVMPQGSSRVWGGWRKTSWPRLCAKTDTGLLRKLTFLTHLVIRH